MPKSQKPPWLAQSHRARHRALSHASAHAEDLAPGAAGLDHPLIPRGSAPLIATQEGLQELIEHLRSIRSFAYDSEFIGELTYVPKLCLMQVATSQRVALVDPLAGLDLQGFWDLLCDPTIEKIVHAGQQDLEPVLRCLGRPPANVFDTQIAAGFAAITYPVSLSRLVNELTGARLGKSLTFSHWDQRPLSAVQLRYAADDVRYLPKVRAELGKRLEALGHTDWAMQECATICDPALYRFDPDVQCLRVRGAGGLAPQGLAVLRELVIWRDNAARAHDVPPRSFLRDEILAELARNPAKTAAKLERVRGLPRPIEASHGAAIVEATLRGLAMPADQMPAARQVEESPTERFCADGLWSVAQALAAGQAIDPGLVASRHEVGEFYRALAHGAHLSSHRLMQSWRAKAVGEHLVGIVQQARHVELRWNEGRLRAQIGQQPQKE